MTDHPTSTTPTAGSRANRPTTTVDWSGLPGRLQRLRQVGDRALQLAAEYRPEPAKRKRDWQIGRRLDEAYAYAVLLAPLAVAGWFQAHAVHTRLELPWALAVAFTVAWEGAAAYCARLFVRALLRRDSTLVLRLGMYAYAGISCGLLWWNLHIEHEPWYLAAAVGALTASGIFLWTRRARDMHRDALHAQGLVDAQVVKFSIWSWLAAPIETARAFRFAIKHRISHPIEAIESYRADRQRRRQLRALRKARLRVRANRPTTAATARPAPVVDQQTRPADPTTAAVPDQPTSEPKPTKAPTTRKAKRPTTKPTTVSAAGRIPRSTADQTVINRLHHKYRSAGGYPTTAPTLTEIQEVAGGSRERAGRFRRLLASDHAAPVDAEPERELVGAR